MPRLLEITEDSSEKPEWMHSLVKKLQLTNTKQNKSQVLKKNRETVLQPEFWKCWDDFLNLNKMKTKRLSNHMS